MLVGEWRVFEADSGDGVNFDVALEVGCVCLVEQKVWSNGCLVVHDVRREVDCVWDGGGVGGELPEARVPAM